VAALARAHPDTIIVSDEAYAAFAGDGMLADVASLPNLVVMQTLSKTGMASLRVGYLHAAPPILAEIEKVRMPYNVGALNQRAAIWMLRRCRDLLAARCAEVVSERERLATAMARLPGVRVFASQANLLLFGVGQPGDHAATRAWQGMVDRGVLVRLFDRPGPLAGCARVTIGTPAENDRFLAALTESLPAALAGPG
jgi:histidinol-phosphate aminotransferase